jgi:hypothetical protein
VSREAPGILGGFSSSADSFVSRLFRLPGAGSLNISSLRPRLNLPADEERIAEMVQVTSSPSNPPYIRIPIDETSVLYLLLTSSFCNSDTGPQTLDTRLFLAGKAVPRGVLSAPSSPFPYPASMDLLTAMPLSLCDLRASFLAA